MRYCCNELKEAKMNKGNILSWMGEIYHYTCHDCGQSNLSRDEVHATKSSEVDTRSKCCGAKVRKARFSSLIEKKYYKPFYICETCNKPAKVEEKSGKYICLKCYHKNATKSNGVD